MPCDTPPPPSSIEDITWIDEDPDESMYEVIEMDEVDEMPVSDDALVTFSGHSDAVFCCNFDKTGHYLVTGGQDEKAFVWSIISREVKFECTGHLDSVIAVNFSPDSNYVATADMHGFIQLWSMEYEAVIWDFDTFEITWTLWLHGSNVFIAGSVDGSCMMWELPDGSCTAFEHSGTGCSMGGISHNDTKLVTGYQDGTLKFWNILDGKLLSTLASSVGHKKAITSIVYSVDDSLILTGSEDGKAKLIKASDYKVLWTIDGCDSNHHNVSVESVGFCNTLSFIVIGTNCGSVGIWDLQTKAKRHDIRTESSVVKIICDESRPVLYAAIGDGVLRAYDIRNGCMLKYWDGHKAALFDLAISSDRNLLLTASEDHQCKLFERGVL